jgi:hypothetical protein
MENTSNDMKSASLKSAVKAGIIRNVSPVRKNETGYLFVTVLGNGGKATNVYFGQKSAEQVVEGDKLTADQLSNAEFVLAMSKDDEGNATQQRIKMSLTGDSDYTDLASMFDVKSDYEQEVLTALKKDMTSRDETPVLTEEELDEEAQVQADIAAAKALRAAKKLAKA